MIQQDFKPLPIKQLRRIFETAEKGLTRYLHPALKKSMYPRVQDLERFIDLGYSSKELRHLYQKEKTLKENNESKQAQLPKNIGGGEPNHNFARNDSEIIIVNDEEGSDKVNQSMRINDLSSLIDNDSKLQNEQKNTRRVGFARFDISLKEGSSIIIQPDFIVKVPSKDLSNDDVKENLSSRLKYVI